MMEEVNIFKGFDQILWEVAMALIPLIIFFGFFQFWRLKLPFRQIRDILVGLFLSFFGLALFLQGVHVGFMPVGEEIGYLFAGWQYSWTLIPMGFALGFVATFAEPAVRVLVMEVEKVTTGYIPQRRLLITLSIGVAISIALSMARIIYGIDLWHFLGVGYGLALMLTLFSQEKFTTIAFDAGGVATGPMTVTFILAIALGFAEEMPNRDPLIDGFGMIALVALAPIITVLLLGLIYQMEERVSKKQK